MPIGAVSRIQIYDIVSLPKRNEVILVCKRHYPLAGILRDREEKFHYVSYTKAELCTEIMKDEVWILLRDC